MMIRVDERSQTGVTAENGDVSVERQVSEAITSSVEPEHTAHFINAIDARSKGILQRLLSGKYGLIPLKTVVGLSRFLSDECLRHPDWLEKLDCLEETIDVKQYGCRLEIFLKETPRDAALALALFRRRELLRIAVRDGMGLAKVPEITRELSNVADAILGRALK